MSESTFLGTPLTKYDIDDFEIKAKSKRARSYLEAKELKHRQNRELINRNKIKTLYTVDTEEGWTPLDFKSSRTKRATYNFQTLSTFTDQDDSDIISLKVLHNLKLKEKELEIRRLVKVMLKNEGYMERVVGPQLPANLKDYTHLRDPRDLRGIGFSYNLNREGEDDLKSVDTSDNPNNGDSDSKHEGKLKWIATDNSCDRDLFPRVVMDLGVKKEDLKTYHKFDRDLDLADIKRYYKSYYEFIVRPLKDVKEETVEDLLEKYTQMPEFTKTGSTLSSHVTDRVKYQDSIDTRESPKEFPHNFKGRTVSKYVFSKELLSKFKIKDYERDSPVVSTRPSATQPQEEIETPVDIPQALFTNLFGKGNK